MDAVGAQVGEITRCVAGDLVAGIGEAVGVEDGGVAGAVEEVGGGGVVADAAGNLRADHVGALVAVGEARLLHGDGKRLTALEREDRRDGPTADNAIHEAIHVAANPAVAADGNVDDRRKDEAVRGVVGADSVLEIEAVELLGIAEVEAADERVEAD